MALIKCPECSHDVSEYAYTCPSCGCPMSKILEILAEKKKQQTKAEHIEKTVVVNNRTTKHLVLDDDDEEEAIDKFYELLKKYIAGEKVSLSSNVLSLFKDVVSFLKKESKTRYYYSNGYRNEVYYFESMNFKLKFITISEVKKIYAYFKTRQLRDLIQTFEKQLNVEIISDHNQFKNEVFNMAMQNNIRLSSCTS